MPDDISPGTYRTTTPTTNCYWTRLRGFESGLADLIASNIGSGYQVVTIGPRDAGFDSTSCGTWTSDLSQVTDSMFAFAQGTYIVGTDIAPGYYFAGDGASCYWARLSGFGGMPREIIAKNFVTSGQPPTATIEPTDVGFSSSGCGTWIARRPVTHLDRPRTMVR